MHISPAELRSARQGGLLLRYTVLGGAALVLVEVPGTGSSGTLLEEPCRDPHWGIVIRGQVAIERDGHANVVPAGAAYHVPSGGPDHRFRTSNDALILGFVPPDERTQMRDAFDRLPTGRSAEAGGSVTSAVILPAPAYAGTVRDGAVDAELRRLDSWLFSRETFGPTSGYGTGFCDLPHWGLLLEGTLAIDWEDDVELLAPGDLFHCPAGPPGHRLESPDGAVVIGFTPAEALATTERIARWLPQPTGAVNQID